MYVDLSHAIGNRSPVYPQDTPINLSQTHFFEKEGYVLYDLKTNLHVGTHVDVPMHLVRDARFASHFPVACFTGYARMFDVRGLKEIDWRADFDGIEGGDMVLFYTGFDAHYGSQEYYNSHPVLTENLAARLCEKKVKLVGMDTPSPDYAPFRVHEMLLGADIFILENLTNLEALVHAKKIRLHAVPLKIEAEASPVRAYAEI